MKNPISASEAGKLKPRLKEHVASEKESNQAVINFGNPKQVNLKDAYRVLGQPVSKG